MAIAPSTPSPLPEAPFSINGLATLATGGRTPEKGDPLDEALVYHLGTGGGQTRARIALEAGTALALSDDDPMLLAASVELLHNASLVQDDLQDHSEERRGRTSVWKKFGTATAIGLTDYLIASSFQVLGGISAPGRIPALITCLHDAICRTLKGQGMDLQTSSPASVAACMEVAAEKSGPLFALSLELPLLMAGMDQHRKEARMAASDFGVGYQIYDDLEDFAFDLATEAKANLVLLLHEEMPLPEARAKAICLAEERLSSAAARASTLPNGSGRELERLAHVLHGRLEDLGHG